MNTFYDISILVFDPEGHTYKEFVLDFAGFKAVYEYSKVGSVTPTEALIENKNYPFLVTELRTKDNAILLKNSNSKNWGSALLANPNETAILLKRVVYTSKERVLAVDAIALPKEACVKLIKVITKSFKKADMAIDLGGDL